MKWTLMLIVMFGVAVTTTVVAGADKSKREPPIKISAEEPRWDEDGNPWIKFEATASKKIAEGWVDIKARCKLGTRVKADHSFLTNSLKDLEAGDTKELDSPFSSITRDTDASWCEFSFYFKRNMFTDAGTLIKTVCWERTGLVEGKCN